MNAKNIKRIFVFATLILAVIQGLRFMLESRIPNMNTGDKMITNCQEFTNDGVVDNKILVVEDNGITTYPYVAGSRLYLYDLKTKKKQLLTMTILPFVEIGDMFTIADNKVCYNIAVWKDSVGYFYLQEIGSSRKEKFDIRDQCLGYSLSGDMLFYYEETDNETMTDDFYEVYAINLKTGQKEKYFDGPIEFFKIIDDKVWGYNPQEKVFLIKDMDNSTLQEIPYTCEWIYDIVVCQNTMYVFDIGEVGDENTVRLVKFDMNTEESNILKSFSGERNKSNLCIKGDKIYYGLEQDETVHIYEYDLETAETRKIIETKADYVNISFCSDYIALDSWGQENAGEDEHQLSVYDYDGQNIRNEKL